MCWICNINKLKAQIAKEDINVYKIVKKATKEYCISPFMDYTYYSKDIQPSLTLGVTIEPRSIFAKITEGYHSYTGVQFVCNSAFHKVRRVYRCKRMIFGNRRMFIPFENDSYIATFIIPKGAAYTINSCGEIVSNKIMYTGRYLKL